eukprot:scaffold3100_cov248-Pinguiococcus_pyrenoidosus.AAC.17
MSSARCGRMGAIATARDFSTICIVYWHIEVAQVRDHELQHRLHHPLELALLVGLVHVHKKRLELVEDVLVLLSELLAQGRGCLVGREVTHAADQVSERVPDLAVVVERLLDDVVPDGYVRRVVYAGDPHAQRVGAVRRLLLLVLPSVDDLGREHDVAERLAHLAPLLVHDEAVGEHRLVRSLPAGGNAREEGTLEPAAMLVAALQVQVDGIGQRAARFRDASP